MAFSFLLVIQDAHTWRYNEKINNVFAETGVFGSCNLLWQKNEKARSESCTTKSRPPWELKHEETSTALSIAPGLLQLV